MVVAVSEAVVPFHHDCVPAHNSQNDTLSRSPDIVARLTQTFELRRLPRRARMAP